MLHALIMAGGSGTRFWPVSRERKPKQLLPLLGSRSMIQQTFDRLEGLVPTDRVLVATNVQLADAIAQQLPDLPSHQVLKEPCKRDTAPCIGLASGLVMRHDADATLLIMPADHAIWPVERFRAQVGSAVRLIDHDERQIITFGIRPSYPATIYGYIEQGDPLDLGAAEGRAFRVARFREKPSREVAEQFLSAGKFYWNAGIFVAKARTLWQALQQYEPAMVEHLQAIVAAADSPRFDAVFAERFSQIVGKSIDYAVMERYPQIAVIEAEFSWDDLGNWQSLARVQGSDTLGNCATGKHLLLDTQNAIVWTEQDHLVVLLGMRDVIVVHTPDATLVAHRQAEESLRDVVQKLRDKGWSEYL
jgi:mannose-1-phosphate guanylyltransferase